MVVFLKFGVPPLQKTSSSASAPKAVLLGESLEYTARENFQTHGMM